MSSQPSSNCLGDEGYKQGEAFRAQAAKTAAIIRQVAAIAIALDNANQLVENYKDQRDISDRALKIAEKQQKHIVDTFWPREAQFLAEFSTPETIETVAVMGRRYGGRLASMVSGGFAQQLREARCSFSRYCTSANKKLIQDLLMARSIGIANARALGRNIAFAEFQARNDTNYQRRLQAVAMGRGLMNQAATLYAAAGRGLAAAGQAISEQLSSSLEAFGYARRDYRNALNGAPGGYNSILMQGQSELAQRQINNGRAQVSSGVSSQAWDGQLATFGYGSAMNSFTSLSASNTFGEYNVASPWNLSERGQPSPWVFQQAERQMNEADVGNRDMARFGTHEYAVKGITGGSVTVSMGDFPLYYVDEYNPGDKPNYNG